MQLRPYQTAAKLAVYDHLRSRDDNPCVVIPTAGGKTPVIADICKDVVNMWHGRVIVLAHVKELLEQTVDKLQRICPEVNFGLHSAGLGRRDTDDAVIVAGIQSAYKRACDLGRFDIAIVDEAHLIPPDGEGMYRSFLADAKVINPLVRVIGFTATPFRLKSGTICTRENFLNHVCYEVGIKELIRDGYLCPLTTKAGVREASVAAVHVRGGEFIPAELQEAMDVDELVEGACLEIIGYTASRNACLIFAAGIQHAKHIQRIFQETHRLECGFVCGKTPPREREEILDRFRTDDLKYLVNVNVLTTGFDAPNIDCVAMLRPTLSPGLYYQMVGRGFRMHPGKDNCLVLDFAGNVMRHGPVDQVEAVERIGGGSGEPPAKTCPECRSVIAAGYAVCPDCGYEFPQRERAKHAEVADDAPILSSASPTVEEYDVYDVEYRVHTKRDSKEGDPQTMRVIYRVGFNHWVSEYICLEHTGYARQKAATWWRQRSLDPIPATAQRAVDIANGGGLAHPEAITVRSVPGERFDRIVGYRLGPIPEPIPLTESLGYDDGDIPF